MRYKLFSEFNKIISPVRIVLDNGAMMDYSDGEAVLDAEFDKPYCIESISADQDMIVITLKENDMINDTSWSKSDVSFF